jgi:hypothetical protein
LKGKGPKAPATGKSDSFRSFVRASEAAWAREKRASSTLGLRALRSLATAPAPAAAPPMFCWQVHGFQAMWGKSACTLLTGTWAVLVTCTLVLSVFTASCAYVRYVVVHGSLVVFCGVYVFF